MTRLEEKVGIGPENAEQRVFGPSVLGAYQGPVPDLALRSRGDIGAERRLCRRAAAQASPPGQQNGTDDYAGSPPIEGESGCFSGIRWGVSRACGAKTRKSSNGAGFRFRKSLHNGPYRKVEERDGEDHLP